MIKRNIRVYTYAYDNFTMKVYQECSGCFKPSRLSSFINKFKYFFSAVFADMTRLNKPAF
ncbi:MAG: hypothetical protein JWM28_3207 [Chitinophagaceae bacterium]|nr:hypothetical protein [Chitinophagaceae bacterium]